LRIVGRPRLVLSTGAANGTLPTLERIARDLDLWH
jgi:hypothetical protein